MMLGTLDVLEVDPLHTLRWEGVRLVYWNQDIFSVDCGHLHYGW